MIQILLWEQSDNVHLTLSRLARGMRNGNTDIVMIFQQARHQGRFTCAGSGRNDVNIAFFMILHGGLVDGMYL